MLNNETSALGPALKEILNHSEARPNTVWTLEFRLDEDAPIDLEDGDLAADSIERGGIYHPVMVNNVDFISDYVTNFCDHINTVLTVGMGMWLRVLSPCRQHIKVYLTRHYENRQGGVQLLEEPLVYIFKPIFKDTEEAHATISETMMLTRKELDARGLVTLDVDLLDAATEAVQSAPCGGNWRDQTAMAVMRGVFADVCSQLTFEGEPIIKYQQVCEDSNPNLRSYILIKAGTQLTDLPIELHKNHGGLWPTGIGRYLQNDTWYFYPPYDTERVESEDKTLTIVRAPERLYGGVIKTWLKDGDHLKILAYGDIQLLDKTQQNFLKEGSGLRFGTAQSVLDGSWLEVKDNKAVASRAKNLSEVRISAPDYTDARTNNSEQWFTDNPMFQLSNLSSRKGSIISLTWNYADHTLIRPGMPCRILYEEDNMVMEIKGVVVGKQASIQTTKKGASDGGNITTCALFLFCQNPTPA